jgi:hypothetical protein
MLKLGLYSVGSHGEVMGMSSGLLVRAWLASTEKKDEVRVV